MRHPFRCARAGLTASLALLFLVLPAGAGAQSVPGDFLVVASAGSVSPDLPVRIVVFDGDLDGEFCRIDPPDRATGACSFTEVLVFTAPQLDAVWAAVQSNGFFGLDSAYVDPDVADGSYAELTVTANGVTHTVTTHNIAVASFDAVVLAINAELPAGRRLIYNAIFGL